MLTFQPVLFTHTPKAYVCSNQAAKSTTRCRNFSIKKHLEVVAGTLNNAVGYQTSKLVKALPPETRQSILANSTVKHIEISASEMVAMKTDMGIPWEKLKTMSR